MKKITILLRLTTNSPRIQERKLSLGKVKKTVKKVHYNVAKKPHDKLLSKSKRYLWWHTWQYKKLNHAHVHFVILAIWIVAASLVTYRTFASPNDSNVWTFNNPADYTFANDKIESNSNNLRLSLRDKIENFTLAGGKLQSNNVLDVAADDTYYYVSNDLGVDVIRQDTWQRTAYITSGGGFPTIAVENGYLYAGKNGGIYRWQVSSLTDNTPLGSYRYTTATAPALGSNNVTDMDSEVIGNKTYIVVATPTHVNLVKDDLGTPTIVKSSVSIIGTVRGVALSSDGAMYYGIRGGGLNPNEPVMVKYNVPSVVADWGYNNGDVDFGFDRINGSTTHGPDPAAGSYTGIRVSRGTSTANSGDNTIYIESEEGLSVIHENRSTPSQGTVNNYTYNTRGSNLLSGATAKERYYSSPVSTSKADKTIDNDLVWTGYNASTVRDREHTIEYDLGISKNFNYVRQWFNWSSNLYIPNSYIIESSTQGTSSNLSVGTSAVVSFGNYNANNPQFAAGLAIDDTWSTSYISAGNFPTLSSQTFEQVFTNPTSLSAIDFQFTDSSRTAKDYVVESSDEPTSKATSSLTDASSVSISNPSGFAASNATDGSIGSTWMANGAPSVGSPQWLRVDLGSNQNVNGLSFYTSDWSSTAKDYTIQHSTDGTNWTTAQTVTNNSSQYNKLKFNNTINTRYIRIHVTATIASASPTIYELEIYNTMFEAGNVQTLDTVTNNSSLSRISTFSPTTAKSFRIRATSSVSTSGIGIREVKSFAQHFENGEVNQLVSASNLSNSLPVFGNYYSPNHGSSFEQTNARYFRIRYALPLSGSDLIVNEVRLFNTSVPEWSPEAMISGAYDPTTYRYFGVLNTGAPEDGKILRIDGVQTNQLVLGEVIDKTSKPELASDEFNSIHIAGSNKMIVGTSNAGASFIGKRYATDLPTVTPNDAYSPPAVASWKTFEESATKNGGEVYYQISNDDGASWYFWNGTSWAVAGPNDRNTAAEINTNISDFSIGTRDFKWKAFLSSNGSQEITLQSVTVTINPDVTPPAVNADNIQMSTSNGGTSIVEEAWAKTETPYFNWDEAEDDTNPGATGIKGYCLYLGQDETVDLTTSKGLLGVSPLDTDGACAYAVPANSIDLSQPGKLAAQLVSSDNLYYLHIKAIDFSDNIFPGAAETFSFKFDNTPPSSPGYITGPSQFLATRDVTLSWPITGNGAISDEHSGVVGLQYRIGDGTWYGSNHNGAQDASDLLENNGSYRMNETYDYPHLIEGNNIVYFRTLDAAGNFSVVYATAVVKINTASPSSPQSVVVTPPSNTTNSFSFSWSAPATFVGSSSGLKYCYTVNTLPTVNTCTFTAAGVTSLPSGSYATQPGENNFYVVAQDEAGNINYATYASATFSANTSAPGIPLNMEVADISTKSTAKWKVAVSWSSPEDVGTGIANYRVFRSINNQNFTQISSSSGVSYVDANLSQQTYYYRVQACDSANNCGAVGSTVSMYPTGKFTEPSELVSPPIVSNITTKRARVSWATNRESDSRILIGKERGKYSSSEISNSAQVTAHTVDLDNLDAGTTYYILAQWTDEDGNTGRSNEISFKTEPAPYTEEVLVQRIGLSTAQIRFTSISAAKVVIQYGKSDGFGGVKEISTSLSKSTYDVELTGLDDGTKYSYRLNTFDSEGNEYRGGTILSFTTPARPRISNLRFQPLEGEPTSTQQISWKTNVPTTSLIRYTQKGGVKQELSDSKLTTDHELVIKDLVDDSEYSLGAESRDADGNLAVSDAQILKTALDTRPPKISKLKVETSIRGSGSEARGQIVVSWQTDEPATSQVAYDQGSGLTKLNKRTSEDGALATEHIVIIADLATSRVYSVSPISKDKATNEVNGSTKSAIIEKPSDNVMTIVLNALKGVFGF